MDEHSTDSNRSTDDGEQTEATEICKKIKNIVVIGGSGSGKTRFFVKPNLMQMHSSYVVTDPKGTVLVECGKMLSKNDYRIKVLNTINFAKSMHYNPSLTSGAKRTF